jgi:uncharacterized membrane protein YdjX (TVP38/TMEM64 family)
MALIGALIGLVVLYYVIRTAVRDGILEAEKVRSRHDQGNL